MNASPSQKYCKDYIVINVQLKLRSIFHNGESNRKIIAYWIPELISAAILISLPSIIDSWIITRLGTTMHGALGMGTNFLHTLIKLAEAIPVASIAIIGRHNGAKDYEKCGEGLGDIFWTTFILGLVQYLLILLSAHAIYNWLNVPEAMITAGAPFLRLKSIGVFMIFLALGFMSFMRAVKNTQMPMLLNIFGIAIFVFFDYALVLGKFGLPQMGLTGSALATILQYGFMCTASLLYILLNADYKKYFPKAFFSAFSIQRMLHLLNLSWPIIIDKSAIALSYVWLSKMIASIGEHAITSYDVVNKCERFTLLPAIASASVITFIVSNDLGAKKYAVAQANIKKIYLFSCIAVMPAMLILCLNARYFISFFDPFNKFTNYAAAVLPIITILAFFDFTQLVLAGALRGAGDVKTVMWGRFFACACFFVPISYLLNQLTGLNDTTRFILVYGSFYLTTGIMGLAFLYRIKSHKWQNINV